MLRALNALTREWITIYDYKALDPDKRPPLQCPGHSTDGQQCQATPIPCALESTKMRPYFRVLKLEDHVEGCNQDTEMLPTITGKTFLVGWAGIQGPRGPKRIVYLTHKEKNLRQAPTQSNTQDPQTPTRIGHHRHPAPATRAPRPIKERYDLRTIVEFHAQGLIADDDELTVTPTTKGAVYSLIYPAQRLINAPYQGHEIITYGRIASITPGKNKDIYFIRLLLNNGGKTKVSVMINETHDVVSSSEFQDALQNPSHWEIAAMGIISGKTFEHRHLVPHDAHSVVLSAASIRS